MIKNEHQYRITKKLAKELEDVLDELPSHKEFNRLHSKAKSAYVSSIKAQLSQHLDEIKEYESLQKGKFNFKQIPDIEQVPTWLIKARIARGLNQEELADLLHLKKQQIQHYEATDYASASLARIRQVAEALRDL